MSLATFAIVFAAVLGGFLVLHEFAKSKSLSEEILTGYHALLVDARHKNSLPPGQADKADQVESEPDESSPDEATGAAAADDQPEEAPAEN